MQEYYKNFLFYILLIPSKLYISITLGTWGNWPLSKGSLKILTGPTFFAFPYGIVLQHSAPEHLESDYRRNERNERNGRGLENAARGRRPRAAFLSPRPQYFTIRTDPKPVITYLYFFQALKRKKKVTEKNLRKRYCER